MKLLDYYLHNSTFIIPSPNDREFERFLFEIIAVLNDSRESFSGRTPCSLLYESIIGRQVILLMVNPTVTSGDFYWQQIRVLQSHQYMDQLTRQPD